MHRTDMPFRSRKYCASREATRLLPTPPLPWRERCTVVPLGSAAGFVLQFRAFAIFVPFLGRRFVVIGIIWYQTTSRPEVFLCTRTLDDAHSSASGSIAGPRRRRRPVVLPSCPVRLQAQPSLAADGIAVGHSVVVPPPPSRRWSRPCRRHRDGASGE